MALIAQRAESDGSSVTITIEDSVPEVRSVEIVAGSHPVTFVLLNDDGTDRFSVTVPAGQTRQRTLTLAQRRRATLVEHPRQPGVFRLTLPHRIEF